MVRRKHTPSPDLYPLSVVLVAVTLFYLVVWSPNAGECFCMDLQGPHRVRLPVAHEVVSFDDPAPIVQIRRDLLTLDGRPYALPKAPGEIVESLRDELITSNKNFALLHPGDQSPDTYYLIAEGTTPAWVLAAVQRSAAAAGCKRPWYVVEADGPHDEYPYPFW
jgi:hypothetical protein